jgi:mRNA interferase MazF
MVKYHRGEVWLVDLGYTAKTRPCLIISTSISEEDRALVALITHTTSPRSTRFEVTLDAPFLKSGVFDVQNLVTVSHDKLMKRLGILSSDQLAKIETILRMWLGL